MAFSAGRSPVLRRTDRRRARPRNRDDEPGPGLVREEREAAGGRPSAGRRASSVAVAREVDGRAGGAMSSDVVGRSAAMGSPHRRDASLHYVAVVADSLAAGAGGAVAFPGQGVDPVAACAVLATHRDHPLVTHLTEVTDGRTTWSPADLADTRVAQPAVVAAGLLQAEAAGLDPAGAALAVGHSLGEITALAFAGVLRPTDALDLVAARAALGHAAHQARPGRMVASLKLDGATVEWVRRRAVAEVGGVLDVAVVNGPAQVVLSGDRATADRAGDLIAEAGGVPRRLGIGGAFHSSLLVGAVDAFRARVAALDRSAPIVSIVLSTAPVVVGPGPDDGGTDAVPDLLARALVMPVDWPAALRRVGDRGVASAIDVGPGRTLANVAEHTQILSFSALADADPAG